MACVHGSWTSYKVGSCFSNSIKGVYLACCCTPSPTVMLGCISNNDKTTYLEGEQPSIMVHEQLPATEHQQNQGACGGKKQHSFSPIIINGALVERVTNFKFQQTLHGLTISKPRQLRRFGASPVILRLFYSGAMESIITQNNLSWFGLQSP